MESEFAIIHGSVYKLNTCMTKIIYLVIYVHLEQFKILKCTY